jgi:two-component system, response regulator PdtaR
MDHKPRLIVAEDDPLIAWAVKVGLADQGYEVCAWADSAPDAVRLAELHRPDVAVVDFGLADGSDGSDGMAAAREISSRLGIPVVMCSAHADANHADANTEGSRGEVAVVGWVSRPYRICDLNRLIAAAVRH